MYGTVADLRVKRGHESELRRLLEEWNRERKPKVRGALAGYLFQEEKDPQSWIMVGLFQDRDTYFANANDPEQDRWFRQLREHLESEPRWRDGEAIEA